MQFQSPVLPILMQSSLETTAALVAREAKCFCFPSLLDCKDDQFGSRSHGVFEIAGVPLCVDHVASHIINADHGTT
jgi:hypothetical protein